MSTAASNFSHRIEYLKRKEHKLVTHGVYRFIRHPSYLGWFWWIVGSQILLGNPLCAVGYSLVAWSFFHDRIPCVAVALALRWWVSLFSNTLLAMVGMRNNCCSPSSRTSTRRTRLALLAASHLYEKSRVVTQMKANERIGQMESLETNSRKWSMDDKTQCTFSSFLGLVLLFLLGLAP